MVGCSDRAFDSGVVTDRVSVHARINSLAYIPVKLEAGRKLRIELLSETALRAELKRGDRIFLYFNESGLCRVASEFGEEIFSEQDFIEYRNTMVQGRFRVFVGMLSVVALFVIFSVPSRL